ncbi:site-specific integrase [Vibrio sp. SCSIO 43136]|uniref:tyrosine-type recombinase/integrase n=1 Tax=Vibrio sp. SCSIO 43136 TaxID=2819101 RepID=UPI002074B14E|nr:site-specific integrase [Vibrio sp. SCSIO 43136]USD64201.1 site-specific integrase [Vibrio sp. SCSIO 43136]
MAQAKSLTPRQLNKVLNRCLLMPHHQLKRAALSLSFSTLRVTEVAQITIRDVMHRSGELRTEISMRADICKGKRARIIWFSDQTKQMLQEWLDHRKTKRWGLSSSDEYQGFNPDSKVLYCNRGRPYGLKAKNRKLLDGTPIIYYSCDSLELVIRTIFNKCGLKGASSHTGRRSWATTMSRRRVPLKVISKALGHADEQVTLMYIDVSDKDIIEASELAY